MAQDNCQASDTGAPQVEVTAVRQRFSRCRAEISEKGQGAEAVAAAIAGHLAPTTMNELPPAAHVIWQNRVTRPLKSDPGKPLDARAIAGIRSWPTRRVADLVAAIAEMETILVDAENDALNEIIYAEISRAYS